MRKIMFLMGTGIGFILGSRSGRGTYQQLESKVREIARHPEVQDKVEQVKDTAKEQVAAAAEKAGLVPPHPATAPSPRPTRRPGPTPTLKTCSSAPPRRGKKRSSMTSSHRVWPPSTWNSKEEELRETGALSEPPAGNKAKPAKNG